MLIGAHWPWGGDSIPWLAENALGLLASLLLVDETGVGDWEQGPTAVGGDLPSVAILACLCGGVYLHAALDLELLEGGRGGEESNEKRGGSHLVWCFFIVNYILSFILLKYGFFGLFWAICLS